MNDNKTTIQPERVRVSIFERIVPFAAFGLAAAAGGIGGLNTISLLNTLMVVENAGIGAVSGGVAEYLTVSLIFLYAAAALGVVGICVAIGRMVIMTRTASPSGVSYLILGTLSLIPVGWLWRDSGWIVESMIFPASTGAEMDAEAAVNIALASVIICKVIFLVLLAWALIPFKARRGKRFGPLIALLVMQMFLFAAAVMFQLRVAELWRINMAS